MRCQPRSGLPSTTRKRSAGRIPRKDFSECMRLVSGLAEQPQDGAEHGSEETELSARISEGEVLKESNPRKKRARTLVDHNKVRASEQVPENEFERQREERIRRNKEILKQLGLAKMAADFQTLMQNKGPRPSQRTAAPRPKRARVSKPGPPLQTRRSGRQQGKNPGDETPTLPQAELAGAEDPTQPMECEEYFRRREETVEGHKVSGNFEGWVNPEICAQYGIAKNAEEAWESNGGGKFTFKIDKKALPAAAKSRGWSDARAFASTQLQKNPNSYFYRHVAPHEQQAQGEWTEEEHALFLKTAKEHGVGDKWGLFSSYIPQRVGYQCSAYYREVIIPQGLIFDPKFRICSNGRAVYAG